MFEKLYTMYRKCPEIMDLVLMVPRMRMTVSLGPLCLWKLTL